MIFYQGSVLLFQLSPKNMKFKEIKVKNTDRLAFVSLEDFELLNEKIWYCSKFNSIHSIPFCYNYSKYPTTMQSFILPKKTGLYIDHINGNRFDNRRANLRYVSPSENAKNTAGRNKLTPLGMFGVWKFKDEFLAHIWLGDKLHKIGWFKDKIEAAKAYDKIAYEHFGIFARINFPFE